MVITFLLYKVYGDFPSRSRAANSTVPSLILSNSKLTQDFMVGIATCKNGEDPIKNEGARLVTRFPPL